MRMHVDKRFHGLHLRPCLGFLFEIQWSVALKPTMLFKRIARNAAVLCFEGAVVQTSQNHTTLGCHFGYHYGRRRRWSPR